jgi:hypothetical protein
VSVRGCAEVRLRTAATAVLVLAVVLLALTALRGRVASVTASSAAPDSTTVDRLTASYFGQGHAATLAMALTAGQKASILAAGLLLSPIFFPISLPLLSK